MRDLKGYGRTPPDPKWPNGARVAVNFVMNYEEGSEPSIGDGEPRSERGLTEMPLPDPDMTGRDLAAEGMFAYGSRVGFWRLMRLLPELLDDRRMAPLAQFLAGPAELSAVDAGPDLRAGRCYFPAQSLAPLGLDAATLCAAVQAEDVATLSRLEPLLQTWQHQTEALLHDGLRYSLALRGRRLRLASALPCLIGIRTLTLLRQAGVQSLLTHVKLPRREVRRLLMRLVLSGVSDRQLQACWNAGLPATSTSPVSARIGA